MILMITQGREMGGQPISTINALKVATIFTGVAEDDLEQVAVIARTVEYTNGDVIFEQGAASDELYIIASGEVDILVEHSDAEGELHSEIISTLRAGQSFGEVALVDKGVRSATARCGQSGTVLLVLPSHELLVLCQQRPQLGFQMMHNLAASLARIIRDRTAELQLREWLYWAARPC